MFQLFMPKNYPVVRYLGKDYIIDTGAPSSFNFAELPWFEINNRQYEFDNFAICSKSTLDQITESDISGIIGMDILQHTGLTINLETMSVDFSGDIDNEREDDYAYLSFGFVMGAYIVTNDVFLGCQLENALIDTGAPISYVSSRRMNLLEKTGEMYRDLLPEYGVIQGEYACGNLTLHTNSGEHTNRIKVGTIPSLLDEIRIFDAILGITALTDKRIVFDFHNRVIGVKL